MWPSGQWARSGSYTAWMRVARVLTILFLALFLGAPTASADESEAARLAELLRRRLVDAARRYVDPGNAEVGSLGDIQRSLAPRREILEGAAATATIGDKSSDQVTPDMLRWFDILLGRLDAEGQVPPDARGVIREGASWFRQVIGRPDDAWKEAQVLALVVRDDEGKVLLDAATVDKLLAYLAAPQARPAAASGDGTAPAAPAEDPERTAVFERAAKVLARGEIRVAVPTAGDAPGRPIQGLLRLAAKKDLPAGDHIVAFTAPDELAWPYNGAWVQLLGYQKQLRQAEYNRQIKVLNLVSQTLVEERRTVYEKRQAELEALRKLRSDLLARIASYDDPTVPRDHLKLKRSCWATIERDLNRSIGRIGFELESSKLAWRKSAGEGKEDLAEEAAPEPLRHQWWRYEFRETLLQQQLRLLYITLLRAQERLRYLDQGIVLLAEDARGAQGVYEHSRGLMERTRREQQLDTLSLYDDEILSDEQYALQQAEKVGASEGRLWQQYGVLLGRLRGLVDRVRTVVQKRRALLTISSSSEASGDAKRDPVASDAEPSAEDRRKRLLNPPANQITVEWAEQHRAQLHDETLYDTEVLSNHYDAIHGLLPRLDRALADAQLPLEVAEGFEQDLEQLEKDFETLAAQSPDFRWRYRSVQMPRLAQLKGAWVDTNTGMRNEIERTRKKAEALRRYQRALLKQGQRSFGVRVQRNLSQDNIEAAFDDASGGLQAAFMWLTFQSDPHLGHYLAENWLVVLLVLLMVVAAFLGVRFGRRALSQAINRAAENHPRLRREAVTVEAEAVAAQVRREQDERAMREAEKQALSDATKDASADTKPAAPPPDPRLEEAVESIEEEGERK